MRPLILAVAMLAASVSVFAEPITISAVDLKAAYVADKSAANAKYKGKDLVVFGYLDRVSGKIVWFESEAYCSMEDRPDLPVEVGAYIVMAGEGRGHTFMNPWDSPLSPA